MTTVELDRFFQNELTFEELVGRIKQCNVEVASLQIEFYLKSKIVSSTGSENYQLIVKIFEACYALLDNSILTESTLLGYLVESYFDLIPVDRLYEAFAQTLFQCPLLVQSKLLLILKVVNKALKRIPHSRSEQFTRLIVKLSALLPQSDRSGVNLRGDFCKPICMFIPLINECTTFDALAVKEALHGKESCLNQLKTFYQSLCRLFNEYMSNFCLLDSESEVTLVLKLLDTISMLYSDFVPKETCSCPICLLESYPTTFDFELFRMAFFCPKFGKFLLTAIIFFTQSLVYAKEFPLASLSLHAPVAVACESRLPSVLSKYFALITSLFGDQYCHNIKLALYSEKCRLKWKVKSCPAFQHVTMALAEVTEVLSLDDIRAFPKDSLGSPLLNACWSKIKTPTIDENNHVSVDISVPVLNDFIAEYRNDPSCATDMTFIWKCTRLLREEMQNVAPLFTLNPVT